MCSGTQGLRMSGVARVKRPRVCLAAGGATALTTVLALVLGGCNESLGVEDDRCSGRIGDPSLPTSCVIVQGRVLEPGGIPVSSVNVALDCFGTETLGCEATPGETKADGTYRLMVHYLRVEGGRGRLVIRAHDQVRNRWAASDTVEVVFAAMGEVAPVYVIDLQLVEPPRSSARPSAGGTEMPGRGRQDRTAVRIRSGSLPLGGDGSRRIGGAVL